tara:strand:+ start:155 stop:910 length:756 start_codon:yes stop_codon:yes gene_type:complete
MKIKEYNEMIKHITRKKEPTLEDQSQKQLEKLAVQPESRGVWKQFVKDNELAEAEYKKMMQFAIERSNDKVKGYPRKENQNEFLERTIWETSDSKEPKPKHMANASIIKEEDWVKYSKGGLTKTKKSQPSNEKNKIVLAMSETPSEEYEMQLGAEIEQFQEWLKKNKGGTYKDFLEDKSALLTDEQKKDPKIIDLEPYLPNFEDVIKQYEKEQEEKKETLEEFIYRRGKEMKLAEVNNAGVASLFKKRLKY